MKVFQSRQTFWRQKSIIWQKSNVLCYRSHIITSSFCVWKNVDDEKKNRVVVNIKDLNVITQFDAYSLSLQTNIIIAVRDCEYISIIDCSTFFYQWRVHSNDRHKLTVVNHREQKSFNVIVMNYKNSSTYVQRQIDRLLREYRHFVRVYVNDIVVFSRTKIEHEAHLRKVFSVLDKNNISIKLIKIFLSYSSISLLDQKIDSLDLVTFEEKLKTIVKLRFSRTLRQLETYLDLTSWLRDYISHYVDISKSFQNRKIELLRDESTIESVKRVYFSKTRVQHSTTEKTVSFDALQTVLTKSFYLVHSNFKRQLFINLNVNKKFEFDVTFYYVKKIYFDQLEFDKYFFRHVIKSIFFLSRLLIDVETKYWFIELKIVDIVWMLKKTRHIVEISSNKTIVYIDHESALDIANQITMTTISIDKFNLRLVRASNYIQRFNFDIRHKSNKQHIVFDVLSRLVNDDINASMIKNFDENELDVLFIISLIEMKKDFRNRIFDDYKIDLNWQKINQILNIDDENVAKLSFCKRENDLIFRSNDFIINDHVYEFRCLCIFHLVVSNILRLTHDDEYANYVKCFEKMFASYYIRNLSRYLRDYLKHCSKCQIYQIKKHSSYDSLQFILISSISFHTIIIDLILTLSVSRDELNITMFVICKFTKRFTLVVDKKTWFVAKWKIALIDRLNIVDWNISKIIISNRDRKFLSDMWTAIFKQLEIRLFYSTAYYFQIDDQFERINQMIEIAFRFYLITMNNSIDWFKILFRLQRHFNNFHSVIIRKTLNETSYEFISLQFLNMLRQFVTSDFIDDLKESFAIDSRKSFAEIFFNVVAHVRFEMIDVITFAQMISKYYYDRKHQLLFMKIDDYVLIRLHHDYNISIIEVFDKKLSQQYVDFFKIIEKIDNLTYRLKLSNHWRIHFVLFVIQLKSVFSSMNDFFNRSRSNQSNFVFVEEDTNQIKSWKIKRFINKRQIKRRDDEYFVKWKDWSSQYDEWRNLSEFDDAQNLIQNYEDVLRFTVFLSNCLQKSFVISSIKTVTFSKFFDFRKSFVVVSLTKKSFTTSTSTSINQTSIN